MRDVLETWVNDADALQYIDRFGLEATPAGLAYLRGREDDYYISLVGELFARLHEPYEDPLSGRGSETPLPRWGSTIRSAQQRPHQQLSRVTPHCSQHPPFTSAAFLRPPS